MQCYEPPYTLTPTLVQQVADIMELVTRWSVADEATLAPHLRRSNRIRTIHASLAIEHNSLSLEQVTAVLEGKTVIGLPREIQEVRNAFAAYEQLAALNPISETDLLNAHHLLMVGLIDDAGHFRRGGVGIYGEQGLVHMASPAHRVPLLMVDLLHWLRSMPVHPLIASSIFHYEFEFIHPFSDGNGRLGRLWQTLILSKWQPMLAYLPVETVIKERQAAYYQALADADKQANATPFIEFMLDALYQALRDALAINATTMSEKMSAKLSEKPTRSAVEQIIALLQQHSSMTIKELAQELTLSTRTIERHLKHLQEQGRLRRVGSARKGEWAVNDL